MNSILTEDALDIRLAQIKGFLVDMDGTLYIGGIALPGAAELMDLVSSGDRRRIVLTNNSSRSRSVYVEKLGNIDIQVTEDDVLTSGDSAAEWLATTELRRPFVLGTSALEDACRRQGLTPASPEDADCVLLGYDTGLTYERLTEACLLVARGLPYYATHPDATCIDPRGLLPDTGAFIAAIEVTTRRRPEILGKPEAPMVQAGMRRLGTAPEATMIIGDQLDTDMTLGIRHGLTAVLTLTGETSLEQVQSSPVQPHLVVNHVGELEARLRRAFSRA